jgi:hypothetical protein
LIITTNSKTENLSGKMQSSKNCGCTITGRHGSCTGECKTSVDETRDSMFLSGDVKPTNRKQPGVDKRSQGYEYSSDEEEFDERFRRMMPDPISPKPSSQEISNRSRMSSDSDLLQKNRNSLRKFESLQIGGQKLTEMSIGGYNVNLEKLAEKAMEVLPMPASKLPIIFVDKDLNFYHHFFQAMKRTLAPGQLKEIVDARQHFDDPSKPLLNCLEDLILTGYEKSDDEMTILLKKVVGGTFETKARSRRNSDSDELEVVANLWGFEYIEQGMHCSEADLQMWLSMCYEHYRKLWFNTFKSTGVPDFSNDGAIKHRSSGSSGSSLSSVREEPVRLMEIERETKIEPRIYKRRQSSSIAGSERRSRRSSNSPVANWLAAKPMR